LCGNLEEAFLTVLNDDFIELFFVLDALGPLLLHDQDSKHVLAEVGEDVRLMKQDLLLPHPVVEERINPSDEFIHNVLLVVIQDVVKPHIMFFETVQEGGISCLQAVIVFVHEYHRMETLMHEALRVQLGSKGDSAVPFFAVDSKVLIE
jgi:hypothetical protein